MIDLTTGNYELAQTPSDPDKEYYFVKLTDSALRAIELYQNSRDRHSSATIQFLGNNGVISFASAGQRFKFTIDEMDGSFQCIKQTRNNLNVEGVMPQRMRVHANEDVFETTKLRMAVAEETIKSKSVREIKPNQKDIGRKVKIESSSVPSVNTKSQSQFRLPKTSTSASSSSLGRKSASPAYQLQFSPRPAISPLRSDSNDSIPKSPATDLETKPFSNCGSRGAVTNSNNNNPKCRNSTDKGKTQKNTSPKGPDITKRKLRDRLIHLLAYKPFKKPELYARLQREGIRDKEKSAIGVILKEISTLKENSFNLKLHIWSSVEEDWPFYDEQELQTLKKRKSQSLKPLPSNTNSSGSLKTRNSSQNTKAGSSPSSGVLSANCEKANRENSFVKDQSVDGPATKKQRISHFKRDVHVVLDSNSGHLAAVDDSSHAASRPGHHLTSEISKTHRTSSKSNAPKLTEGINGSKSGNGRKLDDKTSPPTKSPRNSHKTSENKRSEATALKSDDHNLSRAMVPSKIPRGNRASDNQRTDTRLSLSSSRTGNSSSLAIINNNNKRSDVMAQKTGEHFQRRPVVLSKSPRDDTTYDIRRSTSSSRTGSSSGLTENLSTGTTDNSISNHGHSRSVPNTNNENIGPESSHNPTQTSHSTSKPQYDFIDMPKIKSIEQRRAYKAEFERNYTEYQELEEETERVSKRFKKLALRLETHRQDPAAYEEIRCKIVKEYERTNNDPKHKERKARHDYLHAKLAHIKALVDEFDQVLRSSIDNGGAVSASQPFLQENFPTEAGGFHYYADTRKAENAVANMDG